MSSICLKSVVMAAAVAGVLSFITVETAAQRGERGAGAGQGQRAAQPQPPAGPTPRLPNGKPDLSGHWANPYVPDMARGMSVVDPMTRMPLAFEHKGDALPDAAPPGAGNAPRAYDLPYTEWGLKQWKEYNPTKDGDYAGSCLPFGMSRSVNSPHGLQIVQNPDSVALLFEQGTWFHWVPTNGMKWPADLPSSWTGVSTGRWDGDTLIIETTGFNGYTKLDTAGHPHSKQLKMIQTFLRTDSRTIQHTVTVHDPKTYARDWMNVRTWRIKDYPDVIMEYACEENNLQNIINGVIRPWKAPDDDEN